MKLFSITATAKTVYGYKLIGTTFEMALSANDCNIDCLEFSNEFITRKLFYLDKVCGYAQLVSASWDQPLFQQGINAILKGEKFSRVPADYSKLTPEKMLGYNFYERSRAVLLANLFPTRKNAKLSKHCINAKTAPSDNLAFLATLQLQP